MKRTIFIAGAAILLSAAATEAQQSSPDPKLIRPPAAVIETIKAGKLAPASAVTAAKDPSRPPAVRRTPKAAAAQQAVRTKVTMPPAVTRQPKAKKGER